MSWGLRFYLLVQFLSLLAWLLVRRRVGHLPSGGVALAKVLGVLFFGLLLWLGNAAALLPHDLGGAWLALLVLATLAALAARHLRPPMAKRWLRRRAIAVLCTEVLFATVFAAWLLVRARDPAANHTERPMDLMMLVAATSPTYPPPDPWLAGQPLSYYYLGYRLVAAIATATATPIGVAYNVAQATWLALLVVACFGLGFDLLALLGHGSWRAAAAGGLSAVAVAFASNLQPVVSSVAALAGGAREPAGWWWWQAGRALHDRSVAGQPLEIITEFPFFTFLVGDLHPHLLAMPVLLATASLALALRCAPPRDRRSALDGRVMRGGSRRAPGALLLGIACGSLLAINTWDFPLALLLVGGAAALRVAHSRAALRPALEAIAGTLVIATLLALPHLLTATSQFAGLLPNLWSPTPAGALLRLFGVFLPGTVWLIGHAAIAARAQPRALARGIAAAFALSASWLLLAAVWATYSVAGQTWLRAGGVDVSRLAALVLSRWSGGTALAVLLLALATSGVALAQRSLAVGLETLIALAACGLLMLAIPELVYVHDLFGTRMNTVFKLHLEAWLLLGIVSAVATVHALSRRPLASRVAGFLSLALLAVALPYAPAAMRSKLSAGPGQLDALAYVGQQAPGELAAQEWIRAHTRPADVVVQASGESYHADECRVSAATGRPTLLGWIGHEAQWRGAHYAQLATGREAALRAVYRGSVAERTAAARQWSMQYVVIGPAERVRYGLGPEEEAALAASMIEVCSQDDFRIFRAPG